MSLEECLVGVGFGVLESMILGIVDSANVGLDSRIVGMDWSYATLVDWGGILLRYLF